jgi:hypothetical protein
MHHQTVVIAREQQITATSKDNHIIAMLLYYWQHLCDIVYSVESYKTLTFGVDAKCIVLFQAEIVFYRNH